MKIKNCYNVDDFRKLAKKKLPAPIFNYLDGGSDDEVTLRNNSHAFSQYDLIPQVLCGVDKVDLTTSVLGSSIKMPLFFAPAGAHRLYQPGGECISAKACSEAHTLFGLSTLSTASIETIGALTASPKLFQIYIHKDQGLTKAFIERAKAANFDSLCLTVDTTVAGNRERDFKSGFTVSPQLTLKSLFSFATHPRWSLKYLCHRKISFDNLVDSGNEKLTSLSVIDYVNTQFKPTMTWEDAEFIVKQWQGPFAIKGISSVADAKRAVEIGASAIMLSNHGGRQLDYSPAPFAQLPEIVDAVGNDIEIIVDGGIRRGSDVIKAIALGATACSTARPFLYALAAGGLKGVQRMLQLFYDEIERDMILLGCRSLSDLNEQHVKKVRAYPY